jgi:glutaredoxin-related protein
MDIMTMGKSEFVDRGRVLLHGLVYADAGNKLPPLRWTRSALRFANDLLGRPICSQEELDRRQADLTAAEAALSEEQSVPEKRQSATAPKRDAAPVVMYITDQDMRTRKKLEDILKGRDIPFLVNDVTDDESSRSWALTQAKATEFPLVFVAGEPLGGLDEVMQLDVRGELVKKVFG